MRLLADQALYTNTEYCLQFLRALPPAPAAPAPERFHLYWRGEFGRKQALCLKSFLATQDTAHFALWLWLDGEAGYAGYDRNPFLRPFLPCLHVRRFDAKLEARGTPLAGRFAPLHGLTPTRRSNFVRYVVLHNYGGTYADIDMLFLRDLRPLYACPQFGGEFCYQWVNHLWANGAILRLRQGGAAAHAILERCLTRGSYRPSHVLEFAGLADLGLLVLPCAFFDPLWPHHDLADHYPAAPFTRFSQFFRPFNAFYRRRPAITSTRDFFPGAFAYHWHNWWDLPIRPNSYFGLFEAEFDRRLGFAAP